MGLAMYEDEQPDNWQENLGLLLLRLGLAWFIFVWAVNKFLAPAQYASIWKNFHGFDIGSHLSYWIGGAQILVCLLVAIGYKRTISYGVIFAMHAFTTIAVYERIIDPFKISERGFPVNRGMSITFAVFLAFAALWLLRNRDHWSLDVWLEKRRL